MPRSSAAITRAAQDRRYPSSRNSSSAMPYPSSTIPAKAGTHSAAAVQVVIEIDPMPILRLDQIDLPIPSPALDLFFSTQGRVPVVVALKPYQAVHSVFGGESRHHLVFVFPDSPGEVGRPPDVQRAIRSARQ